MPRKTQSALKFHAVGHPSPLATFVKYVTQTITF